MDFSLGRFPVDLIIFALIAAFLALRLRSVLGRRIGIQPMPSPPPPNRETAAPVIEGRAGPQTTTRFDVPTAGTRLGQALATLSGRERSFSAQQFLTGAEAAFRLVVTAFATGDRAVLRERLTPDAYAAFDAAITAREQAGQTQHGEIRAVNSIAIEDVRLTTIAAGDAAAIDTRIVSDQISYTRDAEGQMLSGIDAMTEFSDLWTFETLVGVGTGINWRLAAARSA